MRRLIPVLLALALLGTPSVVGRPASPVVSRVFRLEHITPADAEDEVRRLLSRSGRMYPNAARGTLTVRDTPLILSRVDRELRSLDVAQPPIVLHVRLPQGSHAEATVHGAGSVVSITAGDPQGGGTTNEATLTVPGGTSQSLTLQDEARDPASLGAWCVQHRHLPSGTVVQRASTGVSLSPHLVGKVIGLTVTPWIRYHTAATEGTVALTEAAVHLTLPPGETAALADRTTRLGDLYRTLFGTDQQPWLEVSGQVQEP